MVDSDLGFDKYILSADRFYIKEVKTPKIYIDEVYLNMPENALHFNVFKDNTLYQNGTSTQYTIENNQIIIEKNIELDTSNPDTDIAGLTTSPIGFNFVEVDLESKLTYKGGKYDVWTEGDKRISNIGIYADPDGNTQANFTEGAYFKVTDFSSHVDIIENNEWWLWGRNDWVSDFEGEEYSNVYGENTMSFDTPPFCNEGDIVTSFPTDTDGGDNEDVYRNGSVRIDFDLEISIPKHYTESGEEFTHNPLPKLHIVCGDFSLPIWYVDDDDLVSEDSDIRIYKVTETSFRRTDSAITSNSFTIGHRYRDGSVLSLDIGTSPLNWIKINYLNVKRTSILSEFSKRQVYAHVYGRVDDINGRYTGVELVTFSGESQGDEGYPTQTRDKISGKVSSKIPTKQTKGTY